MIYLFQQMHLTAPCRVRGESKVASQTRSKCVSQKSNTKWCHSRGNSRRYRRFNWPLGLSVGKIIKLMPAHQVQRALATLSTSTSERPPLWRCRLGHYLRAKLSFQLMFSSRKCATGSFSSAADCPFTTDFSETWDGGSRKNREINEACLLLRHHLYSQPFLAFN